MNVVRICCRLPAGNSSAQSLRCHWRILPVCSRQQLRFNSTGTLATEKLPVELPATGAVNLSPLRGLLALHGPDAAKFLQGLITKIFPSETEPTGMFTSFLAPQVSPVGDCSFQGRILFDTFIYTATPSFVGIDSPDQSPVYIIDIDKSLLPNLKTHLKRYKLRSKYNSFEIPPSQLQVFSVWPTLPQDLPNADSLHIIDPRSPHLGVRLLSAKPPSSNPYPPQVYHIRRTLHGVPEGPEEILEGVALPAESNLDVMSGVDYTKGCYVGQELTSRTYHTGVIRKRLLPMSLFPADGETEPLTLGYNPLLEIALPPSGTPMIVEGEKRNPGKFLRGWGNLGWGLCRLDYVGRVLKCRWDGGEVLAKPFLPEWGDREKDEGSVEPLK